jgi:hypothetical protein
VLLYWSSRAEAAPAPLLLLKALSIGLQCVPGGDVGAVAVVEAATFFVVAPLV